MNVPRQNEKYPEKELNFQQDGKELPTWVNSVLNVQSNNTAEFYPGPVEYRGFRDMSDMREFTKDARRLRFIKNRNIAYEHEFRIKAREPYEFNRKIIP